MRRYYAKPDEFIGFENVVDVINHNTRVFDRYRKSVKKTRVLFTIVTILLSADVIRLRNDVKECEKRIKELEEKGD